NAEARLGSNVFYNTFAIGYSPGTSQGDRYSFGYGIGTRARINDKFFMNIDAMAWSVHYKNLNDWKGINMVNQLRILGGWQIAKPLAIFAGPVINVEVRDAVYDSANANHIFTAGSVNTKVSGWIGWCVGVQLLK